jgi:3-oxoacyl-[acyl-carrier protein] reductase
MKTLLISGGSKGIGKSIIQKFLKNKFRVISFSRSPINPYSSSHEHLIIDISKKEDCQKLAKYIIKNNINIDVLINNAGIIDDSLTKNMTTQQWDNVINTNLNGTFHITSLLSKVFLNQKKISIINVSSVVTINGNVGQANYVASKAAIEGLTKVWAKEFAYKNENIRVNCINPGFVETDMLRDISEEKLSTIKDKITLKRFGSPDEIAKVVYFLSSDDASYITGQIIHVNGGLIL